MAYSQASRTSSGYWSSQASTPNRLQLNPHYLCYWLDSCKGQHELDQCDDWKEDLNGKLGIYYTTSNDYRLFTRDGINGKDLKNNRTGCTTVHLLVFNDDKKEILFGLKRCKERKNNRQERSLRLTFPSAKPFQRNGDMTLVAHRAFLWLTTDTRFADQCIEQGLKKRFLFQNANVIYLIHLTNEQASTLTQNFRSNEEFQSLHWFSLAKIRSQLPAWPNYITQEETENELAQIHQTAPVGIHVEEYELWHVVVTCLMCIREHVPGRLGAFVEV